MLNQNLSGIHFSFQNQTGIKTRVKKRMQQKVQRIPFHLQFLSEFKPRDND